MTRVNKTTMKIGQLREECMPNPVNRGMMVKGMYFIVATGCLKSEGGRE